MTDRPIIFSAPMVRALLDGRKTMTRRIAWRPPVSVADDSPSKLLPKGWRILAGLGAGRLQGMAPSPWQHVQAGDRLWVRENFSKYDHRDGCWYWADGREAAYDAERPRPSIHMPRWASRLTLIVTATKIERLQDMSPEDAAAEGCEYLEGGPGAGFWIIDGAPMDCCAEGAVECFERLWVGLHGEESWDANPEVVALSFRVVEANIDAMEARAA